MNVLNAILFEGIKFTTILPLTYANNPWSSIVPDLCAILHLQDCMSGGKDVDSVGYTSILVGFT